MSHFNLSIAGKKVALRFGAYSVQLFNEQVEKGKRLFIRDMINELGIAYVLYTGYINACEVKTIEPEITFEQFYDFVESGQNNEVIKLALDEWSSSKTIKELIAATTDTKKKTKKPSAQVKSGK